MHDPLFLANVAALLTFILILSYLLSFGARFHWALELFNNFIIQYAVGGVILALANRYYDQPNLSAFCAILAIACLVQIYRAFPVQSVNEKPNLAIAHFNRLYTNEKYDLMTGWLRENAGTFDIVSIHEETPVSFEKLKAVSDLYPYRFPETRRSDTDVCLLSRYPLTGSMVPTKGNVPTLPGLRIAAQTPAGEIVVYGLHAESPLDYKLTQQRNAELHEVGRAIAADPSPYKVFLGDWNITPFSPHFKELLKISGLKNEYSQRWPLVTWPSRFILPFLKIPIDHVLFSDKLGLVEKKTGPNLGSDHHSVVTTFTVTK